MNILPKKSFATDYSYRAGPDQQRRLLAGWVRRLAPMLMPGAGAFALDFHPIPYRGDEAVLENHYIPGRGTARASSLRTRLAPRRRMVTKWTPRWFRRDRSA